jgi:hypothetical protein
MFCATAKQRAALCSASVPVTDPLAQDYAAWRRKKLRHVLAWSLVLFFLPIGTGSWEVVFEAETDASDDLSKIVDANISVGRLSVILMITAYVVITAFVPFCFLILAAWKWYRVRWSKRLACWAWIGWFFGPVPIFLVPGRWLLNVNESEAFRMSADEVRVILTFFLSSIFGLIPGILSASMTLKCFLPQSQLPGRLAVLAAPFCSVVYLLTLALVMRVTVHPELVAGLSLLAAAPWVYWVRSGALLRTDSAANASQTVRWISLIHTGLTLAGLVLLARFISDFPFVTWLLGKLSLTWFLRLLAGSIANRTLLMVVFCDYVVKLLYRSQQLRNTPPGQELEQRVAALGAAGYAAELTR